MSAKLNRTPHGPGWIEVILGALLSLILGVVVGAALLVARPVITAKDTPKEADRDPKAVYFVQGARDPSKSRSALAKRKAFGEGQSVTLAEDELNALAALSPNVLASPGAETPPPAPKKADAAKPAESAAPTVSSGALNFRMRDGKLQVSVPMTIDVLGLAPKVIVQANGTFVKADRGYTFEPETIYVGSLPLHRLPFATGFGREKLLSNLSIPDDVAASWAKLASVAIEGNTLKLTMP
jgi:hypothetical protein